MVVSLTVICSSPKAVTEGCVAFGVIDSVVVSAPSSGVETITLGSTVMTSTCFSVTPSCDTDTGVTMNTLVVSVEGNAVDDPSIMLAFPSVFVEMVVSSLPSMLGLIVTDSFSKLSGSVVFSDTLTMLGVAVAISEISESEIPTT